MDDGEIDFSNQEVFSSPNIGELPESCSMDSFFDELLKDTCFHTHTCNPPGPDFSHTHTCFHVHTKIVPVPTEDKVSADDTAESSEKKSKKCPTGNREAVRKYREKKKARTASLEDEVVRLRAVNVGLRATNQQLVKTSQVQDAEIASLNTLLLDIRGRIDGEIGSFHYQRPFKNGDMCQNLANQINPCNVQCVDQVYCQGIRGCEFENLQCLGNQNAGPKEFPGCGLGNVASTVNFSSAN